VQGVVKLPQALIRDKRVETLFLLPASQTRDKDALTEEGVGRVIAELRTILDWVICDSPAGAHWERSAGPAGFESKRKMLGKRTPLWSASSGILRMRLHDKGSLCVEPTLHEGVSAP
jgi:hypothetical protein